MSDGCEKTDPVLDVTFHVETGAKVRIGQIRVRGLKRVHEKIVRRRLLVHTGDQYNSSAVERPMPVAAPVTRAVLPLK